MNQLNLSLPEWVDSFLNEQPKFITEQEAQMRFVLALTERNIRKKTGGPFGSAVFEIDCGAFDMGGDGFGGITLRPPLFFKGVLTEVSPPPLS